MTKMQRDGGGELLSNLQSEVVEVEEVMPMLEDQQMVSLGVEAKWKTRQRLTEEGVGETDNGRGPYHLFAAV